MSILEQLPAKEWLELNAKLQKKKSDLRKELAKKGILQRNAVNTFDKYKYFSEAQYKLLFTELFSNHNLELKFEEYGYELYEGTEKQANGRLAKLIFTLFDIETGFYETTTITGEALDKGDKAGYKAYTGALKYYLANTFMVATGDDAEKDSTEAVIKPKGYEASDEKATEKQLEMIRKTYTGDNLVKLMSANNIEKIEDLTKAKASELIGKIMNRRGNNE